MIGIWYETEPFKFTASIPKKFMTQIPIPSEKVPPRNKNLLFRSDDFIRLNKSKAVYDDITVNKTATSNKIGLNVISGLGIYASFPNKSITSIVR